MKYFNINSNKKKQKLRQHENLLRNKIITLDLFFHRHPKSEAVQCILNSTAEDYNIE